MKATWIPAREDAPREEEGRAASHGEELDAVIRAAFERLTTAAGRRWVSDAVYNAILHPEALTYEIAVLISGQSAEAHLQIRQLFGDVSDLVIEEARERLSREPEDVLDELDQAERAECCQR